MREIYVLHIPHTHKIAVAIMVTDIVVVVVVMSPFSFPIEVPSLVASGKCCSGGSC